MIIILLFGMISLVFFKSCEKQLIHAHTERFRISLDLLTHASAQAYRISSVRYFLLVLYHKAIEKARKIAEFSLLSFRIMRPVFLR